MPLQFLTMNGTSDYIKTPSITFDRVVMDITARAANSRIYLDARNGIANSYLQRTGGATDNWGAGISWLKVDGATKTNGMAVIPQGSRSTLEVQFAAVGTDDVNIFSGSSNTGWVEGDIYSVRFFNGSTLVAHYDMTLGNVQDQSGNGFHATLVGGTWSESIANHYLSMDGVDDRISTPAMVATEFIFEMKPRPVAFEQYINFMGNAINRNGSNNGDQFAVAFSAVYIDGVSGTTNTAFVKIDTKQAMRGVLSAPSSGSNGANVFWNGGGAFMAGELYSLKIYNGSELLAHYDMTQGDLITGKLYDISGNSRHATLTGGTWQQEAGEPPTGTPGTVTYATKQVINQAGSAAFATKQTITQNGSSAFATKQVLNRVGSFAAATKQTLYAASSAAYATKQAIYAAGSIAFATQQVITAGGVGGSVSYATKQIINNPGSLTLATKQRFFAAASAAMGTKQRFYAPGTVSYATLQAIVDGTNAIARHVSIGGKSNRANIEGEKAPSVQNKRAKIGGEI
jgi:hypothetical protein